MLPGPVGFIRSPFPRGDPGSPVAFARGDKGKEWSTDSGPERPGVSPRPAMDLLCDPGKAAPLLRTSASTVFKTNALSTPQVLAKRHLPLPSPRHLVLDTCLFLPSLSRAALPSVYARAVGWAAVPFKCTSSGFGANGRDDWESQQCGGEYGFMKIIFGNDYGRSGPEPQAAASRPQRQSGR